MHVMRLTLAIVIISGCFRPQGWTSWLKRVIYDIYRILIISMLSIFVMSQLMNVILNASNPDDITTNIYMTLTVFVACYKIIAMWVNYNDMAAIVNLLTKEPFKPMDPREMEISLKFDKIIRNNTLRYLILIEGTCISIGLTSLFTDFRHRRLTYDVWIPYNYSSYMMFCITYAQQILSTSHSAIVNVACDVFVCGLLVHICCQFDILQYRLRKISRGQNILGYCIHHHSRIYEFAQLVNTKFALIIGFQFMVSALVICSNLYQLTKSVFSTKHILLIMYTSCILTQIFIYCWFGNKVKLKSLHLVDNIFQMDWTMLNNSIKKDLLIIMKRATIPVEFVTAHIITMNLDSFVSLLKTSYSAYNLLVRMQEE